MNIHVRLDDPARRLLDVDDFLCLNSANRFGEGKTELIDGEIFEMNSQFRPHAYAKGEIAFGLRTILKALGSPLAVLTEASVAMPPHDVPEPDIIVTSEPLGRGPVPLPSVALIVEIADTTLGFDMRRKAPVYARHGVSEYWVVDLDRRQIIGHSLPVEGRYTVVATTAFGENLTAATIPDLTIATTGLD